MNSSTRSQPPQQSSDKHNLPKLSDAVSIKYVFGYKTDFKNNIFALDDGRLIYPAGHNIIILDTDHKASQTIIYGTEGSLGITAMAISPEKKYLAFAEETADFGLIHVCELTKRDDKRSKRTLEKKKTFLSLDCSARKFISLSFDPSDEGKYLVALSGEPDWRIIYWNWHSPKPMATLAAHGINRFYHAICQPSTQGTILLLGNSTLKVCKYTQGNEVLKANNITQTKSLKDQAQYSSNYINYCWLNDGNLILATDKGELIYVVTHNMEVKYVLPTSPFDEMTIECIIPFSKGFIVGGNKATIYVYEKHEVDKKHQYVRVDKKIQVPNNPSKVIAMALLQKEETLAFGLSNGSLLHLPFNFDRTSDEPMKFEHVVQNFHTDAVTGLDVCVRKSLVATCSRDKTVKIWNFKELTLENDKLFDETAHSVAFHPSGFQLVVGFADKIRMMNILLDDLVTYKEIPLKGCQEIAFTHGGDRFAVCNGSTIQVYNTYTGDNPTTQQYREHTGLIQQVVWHDNDFGFVSAGLDGNIFNWKLEDNINKQHLLSQSMLVINSICVTTDKVYAACSNQVLYEIEIPKAEVRERDSLVEYKKAKFPKTNQIPSGVNLSQIAVSNSNKFFFMATGQNDLPGSLRVSNYPFTNSVHEIFVHSKPIKKMKVSYNDDHLFTIGEDGLLVVYELYDKETQNKREKEGSEAEYAEDFLISKDEYSTLKTKIEKYERKLKEQEITNKIKYNTELKERDEDIKHLQDEIDKQQAHEKELYELLVKQKDEIMSKYSEEQQLLEKNHRATVKKKENEHKEAMRKEEERLNEIQNETKLEKDQFEEYVHFFDNNKLKIIDEKKGTYEQKLQEEKRLRKEIIGEREAMTEVFEGKREFLEKGAEHEIDELRERNESEIKRITDEMKENDLKKNTIEKKLKTQSTKIEEIKTKLRDVLEQISQIKDHNDTLRKEKDQQEREIREREDTIKEKKKRIAELTKKTQELEKFKFVLDYKIKELKRDIGPREEEIAKMKEQINNMNAEILHFRRTNKNLSLIVADLNLRQRGMQKEIESQNKLITENDNHIKAFINDLLESHQSVNDYKKLKKTVLKLYNKYVQNDNKKLESNMDIQKEFINQRSYLETCVKTLKDKFETNMQVHHQDNLRIMKENVDLIREINDLKRRKKQAVDEKRETTFTKEKEAQKQIENMDKEIEKHNEEIRKYKLLLTEQQRNSENSKRPNSGMKLPALNSSQ